MNNQQIFDEFGNLISDKQNNEIKESKDIFDIEEVENEISNENQKINGQQNYFDDIAEDQDQQYYEDIQEFEDQNEIYSDQEYLYQQEDQQDINQPIIETIEKQNYYQEQNFSQNFSIEFFQQLLQNENDFRNIGIFGDYQSGKTKLIDMIIKNQVNQEFVQQSKNQSDFWKIEKDKKMTIFSKPLSIIFQAEDMKSYLLTIFDTPGHTDLYDETMCIVNSIDSAIFVIDAVQGLTMHSKRILQQLYQKQIPIIFVINKLDRFIHEMRIYPEDLYLIIEQLVFDIEQFQGNLNNNIFFASTKFNFLFCLKNFYNLYFKNKIDTEDYESLLFGETFWCQNLQQISDNQQEGFQRTFVYFILNPIYKVFSILVSKNVSQLENFIEELQLNIELKQLQDLEIKDLIKNIYNKKFNFINHFENQLLNFTPICSIKNKQLIEQYFQENITEIEDSTIILQIIKYEPQFVKDEKIINKFNVYVRVINSIIQSNTDKFKNFCVNNIYGTLIGDQKAKLNKAYKGNIVLLENIIINEKDQIIYNKNISYQQIQQIQNGSFVKLSIEPFKAELLNQFLQSLQKLKKNLKGIQINNLDTGEYQLLGRGEVQLDIAMFLLREVLENQEIRVSEPFVQFTESIQQTSQLMPEIKTLDLQNKFQFLAEPLNEIFKENFSTLKNLKNKQRNKILKDKFQIDQFTINSLWAFNQDDDHPSYFFEQSLQSRQLKKNILQYKEPIVQGFQWAMSKGPLCQEPIRDCEFKLINFELQNQNEINKSQIIPTIQKGIHSSMLLAQPCLKEPVYEFEIITIKEAIGTLYDIITKRRGQIFKEITVPGFSYLKLVGQIPQLDSFGFEIDIKAQTLGQSQLSKFFSKWNTVPGDPLNTKIKIKKLEPSEPLQLARDILLKMRRRKGLVDDISLVKYFDDEKDILNLVSN